MCDSIFLRRWQFGHASGFHIGVDPGEYLASFVPYALTFGTITGGQRIPRPGAQGEGALILHAEVGEHFKALFETLFCGILRCTLVGLFLVGDFLASRGGDLPEHAPPACDAVLRVELARNRHGALNSPERFFVLTFAKMRASDTLMDHRRELELAAFHHVDGPL